MNICTIIEDILPLYTDGLLQEDTAELVKKHLATCRACSAKEKQLKAALPVPPPNPEGDRLRRIKRKVQLRALLISTGSILLAVGIFLAAYLPFYFQRQVAVEEIYARESMSHRIEANLRGSNVIIEAPFEITQAEGVGERAECDGISFRLPTSFREIEDGYYGNYEIYEGEEQLVDTVSVVRYESYDQLSDYEYLYDSTDFLGSSLNQRMHELYDRGYELMKLRGVENNYLNLALAAARFDFDVIYNDPTDDELALAVFFSCNYRYLLVNGPTKPRRAEVPAVREPSGNTTVLMNTVSNISPCWFSVSPTHYYEFYGKLTGFLTQTTVSYYRGSSTLDNIYWRAVFKGTDERYYYIIDITDNYSISSSADGRWQSSFEQIQSLLESIRFE